MGDIVMKNCPNIGMFTFHQSCDKIYTFNNTVYNYTMYAVIQYIHLHTITLIFYLKHNNNLDSGNV